MALGRHQVRVIAGLLALALLAACGGKGAGLIGAVAGKRGNQAVNLDTVSRGQIEEFGTAILRAKVPGMGLDLLMSVRDTRGDVVTWESVEGITFAFRNGILIESRGLGPDLMSAAAPSVRQLTAGGSYPRTYYYVAAEERNEPRLYTCTPSAAGAEAIVIYGKTHRTQLISEECLRDAGRITNEFRYEGSLLRQSRQWVSPNAGYAEFSLIVD